VEDSRSLITEVTDSLAILRFNRPRQRNSLSSATLKELQTTLDALFCRDELHAVIVTGSDYVFASGADISELMQLAPDAAIEFSRLGQSVFQMIADAPLVTIAAISGFCMGGALDLALACDIRVAAPNAVFAHPGAKRGIITGWGGTQRLPRIIGRHRALELFVTAREVHSEEALQIGLVTSVCEPVLVGALEIANRCQKKIRRRT
jgi:enoyl-CoA hydratase